MIELCDFILILKDFMSHEMCDEIIKHSSPKAQRALVVGNVVHESRTCSQVVLDFQKIFDSYGQQAIRTYRKRFPDCKINHSDGWLYVKYEEGQFYKEHCDQFPGNPRLVTISVSLNDDYEGGMWGWWGRKLGHKGTKGDALMFPSNWMFPHEITEVTAGTRHALINWFSA